MYIWLFIVPILAKTLAGLEDVASITVFDYSFNLQLSLPFSWKVFYFSALFFAAANLLLLSRCYSLIKDHKSFTDFREQGKQEIQLSNYAKEIGMSLDQLNYRDDYDQAFLLEGKHLQEPFWRLYEQLDEARLGWRIGCSFLYSFGFVLMSIILYQNFVVVLRLII